MHQRTNESPTPLSSPCGLYVHVPFCRSKCGYCDFYSVPVQGHDTNALVEGIGRELETRLRECGARPRTVFVGGGTPTILPPAVLSDLLRPLGRIARTCGVVEFTVEANPATVDDVKARLLVASGVDRVSMGAQSFLPDELATLERTHAPQDIAPSVATLRRGGVGQVNLDLIFGIPGQTMDTWRGSLRRAIELAPEHVACYGLTYEPGTRLAAMRQEGRVEPCGESLEADMYLCAIDTLAEAGYEQYETSNFARPGRRCRHNLIYWRNEPYIGVGPSAAGCINGRRYKNVADVEEYVRMIESHGLAEGESEIIDTRMLMTEMVMMQLRLVEGLSIVSFRERTRHDPLEVFGPALTRLTKPGLVTVSPTHIALTREGRLVSDAIMAELAACAPA